MKLFDVIKSELGKIDIIVEDLGFLIEEIIKFIKKIGFLGMKVLEFVFDGKNNNLYLFYNYERNFVVYIGIYDNDIVKGWFDLLGIKSEVENLIEYLKLIKEEGYNWGFIRGVWSSVVNVFIVLM